MPEKLELDTFTKSYLACALWSSTAYGSPEERKADPNHEVAFHDPACVYAVVLRRQIGVS